MWQLIPLLYIAIGIILLIVIALKPKLFWPILIFVTVGTVGLVMAPYSSFPLSFVDEYLTGCIILGCLLAVSMGAVRFKKNKGKVWDKIHILVFSLLIFYMLLQSIRGLLLWEDLTLFRWIIYYLMIGILAFVLSRSNLPVLNTKKISLIILASSLIYLILYLSHGLFNKIIRGLLYQISQGVEWAGPAYAVFPLVVAMPAAIFIFKYGPKNKRWLSWILVIIAIVLAYFYNTRIGLITIIIFIFASLTVVRLRQTVLLLLILFGLIFLFYGAQSKPLLNQLLESVFFRYSGDSGRWVTINAAINAISESLPTLFFGYGIHSHHFVLGPYMKEAGHSFPGGIPPPYVRVTGFGSLVTDIGLVGILLFVMNFLVIARKIVIQRNSPGRTILLLSLFLPFVWILFCKIEDIVLLWFMIMPSGLLIQMAKYRKRLIGQ